MHKIVANVSRIYKSISDNFMQIPFSNAPFSKLLAPWARAAERLRELIPDSFCHFGLRTLFPLSNTAIKTTPNANQICPTFIPATVFEGSGQEDWNLPKSCRNMKNGKFKFSDKVEHFFDKFQSP